MKKLLLAFSVCFASVVHAAPTYTNIWTGYTSRSASGVIAEPDGNIEVNLSLTSSRTEASKLLLLHSSSSYGTFYGRTTADDLYTADLPGTNDFVWMASQNNETLYTLTFSKAVENPVFHVYNLDYRSYNFIGNFTATVLSGYNLATSGNIVGDNNPRSYDMGYTQDSSRGNPGGSAYGSFQLNGTFTTIQWTRPLVGFYTSDGNALGISLGLASTTPPTEPVPEPGSLALAGLALGLMGVVRRHRRISNAA